MTLDLIFGEVKTWSCLLRYDFTMIFFDADQINDHIYNKVFNTIFFYRLGCVVERWKLFLALMLGTSLENAHLINGGQESTFFEKTRCD